MCFIFALLHFLNFKPTFQLPDLALRPEKSLGTQALERCWRQAEASGVVCTWT